MLTSKRDYVFGDAAVVHSVEEALALLSGYPSENVYIIGGGKIDLPQVNNAAKQLGELCVTFRRIIAENAV